MKSSMLRRTFVSVAGLVLASSSFAATETFPAVEGSAFPMQVAVSKLANELYPNFTYVDESGATLTTLSQDVVVLQISASGNVDAPASAPTLHVRRHIFVREPSVWARVADEDIDVRDIANSSYLDLRLSFRAGGIAAAVKHPELANIGGWHCDTSINITLDQDIKTLAKSITNPTNAAAAVSAAMSHVKSHNEISSVTDANGNTMLLNANQTWGDGIRALAAADGKDIGLSDAAAAASGSFWDCVDKCFSQIGHVITWTELLCVTIGLAACGLAGPGFPACAALVIEGCGIVGLIGHLDALIACLIKCAVE